MLGLGLLAFISGILTMALRRGRKASFKRNVKEDASLCWSLSWIRSLCRLSISFKGESDCFWDLNSICTAHLLAY